MATVKLMIPYNEKNKIIKSDIIVPIQTGRIGAKQVFEEMLGDDTGDNISVRNPWYAELTAQYWAWKNYEKIGNPDYIGFMHPQRHFIFNENYFSMDAEEKYIYGYSSFPFKVIEESYFDIIGLNNEKIYASVDKIDIIAVKKGNLKYLGHVNNKEEFLNRVDSYDEDYNKFIDIILSMYPEYKYAIKWLNNGPCRYFYNMFIMKKNIFFEYSSFLFSILEEFYQQLDTYKYKSIDSMMICKYLGEFILSIFIYKMYEDNKKVKELYTTFVEESFYDESVKPLDAYKNAIVVGCSNLYAKYLSVYIMSILQNSNKNNKYDIVVLENDMSEYNKEKIMSIVKNSNVYVRFYNVEYLFGGTDLPISSTLFSKHCYYRLAIGKIFNLYNMVLYTDIDIAVNGDIADIFEFDMQGKPLAACEEILWTKYTRRGRVERGKDIESYVKNELGCADKYYNTGVLLVDIKKFNEAISFERLVEMAINNNYIFQEQCLLNHVFNNLFAELPPIYNFEIYHSIFNGSEKTYTDYMKYIDEAKLYHYLSTHKVWFEPDLPKSAIWWKYAKFSPFYEEIVLSMIENKISVASKSSDNSFYTRFIIHEYHDKLSYVMAHMIFFYYKKYLYKMRKAFAFGDKRERCKRKYKAYSQLIRDAKKLRKQWVRV